VSDPSELVKAAELAATRKSVEVTRVAIAGEAALDLGSYGKRRVNLIWERTQAIIALSVVEISLVVGAFMVVRDSYGPVSLPAAGSPGSLAFVFLASVANLVIGFYFGRTNHERMGGVAVETR
jgi:hypothetical protein